MAGVRISAVVLALALVRGSAAAQGQQAVDFSELRSIVQPGHAVSVTDTAGRIVTGSVTLLTASALELEGPRARHWTFRATDILRVTDRPEDSLRNGVLWGLGIGWAASTVPLVADGASVVHAVSFGIVTGLLGALVGSVVDDMRHDKRVLFEAPRNRASVSVQMPIGQAGGAAAVIEVRF
jgi:hypothetical protein